MSLEDIISRIEELNLRREKMYEIADRKYNPLHLPLYQRLLILAADLGKLESLKYYCDIPGVDPFIDNNLPLRLAIKNGHGDVVNFLTYYSKM